MIRAVLLDCFGVLVNDRWSVFREQYLRDPARLRAADDLNRATDHGMISNDEYIQGLAELTGLAPAEVAELTQGGVTVNRQLLEATQQLCGRYRIGILSNVNGRWIFDYFSPEQLAIFDDMALSYELGVTKPDKAIYEIAATRLGVQPDECVFVDDVQRNVDGAELVGMQGILHVSTAQTVRQLEDILGTELAI